MADHPSVMNNATARAITELEAATDAVIDLLEALRTYELSAEAEALVCDVERRLRLATRDR